MARGGDTLFKMTTGFLGLATAATGVYLVASMLGAYSSAKVHDLQDGPPAFDTNPCFDCQYREEIVGSHINGW